MSGFSVSLGKLKTIGTDKLPDGVENLRKAGRQLDQADDDQRAGAYEGDSDLFLGLSDKWGTVYETVRHPLVMNRDALELAREAIMEINPQPPSPVPRSMEANFWSDGGCALSLFPQHVAVLSSRSPHAKSSVAVMAVSFSSGGNGASAEEKVQQVAILSSRSPRLPPPPAIVANASSEVRYSPGPPQQVTVLSVRNAHVS